MQVQETFLQPHIPIPFECRIELTSTHFQCKHWRVNYNNLKGKSNLTDGIFSPFQGHNLGHNCAMSDAEEGEKEK